MNKIFLILLGCHIIQGSVNAMMFGPSTKTKVSRMTAAFLSINNTREYFSTDVEKLAEEIHDAAIYYLDPASLHDAARRRDLPLCKLKLRYGVDVNKYAAGFTPLLFAVINNGPNIAQALIAAHANVNLPSSSGKTPLHWAALGGNEGMVLLLINNGANPHLKDNDGRTALYYAAESGYLGIVQLITRYMEHIEMCALLTAIHRELGAGSMLSSLPRGCFENIYDWLKKASRCPTDFPVFYSTC